MEERDRIIYSRQPVMATAYPQVVAPVVGSVVTAAIDFGTACSGYAFAFRHKPLTIYTNAWRADGVALTTSKAPTVVLFDPDGNFKAFGFEAEELFSNLVDEERSEGWYFFQYFKMELYKQENLTRETTLEDIEGKEMIAMKVFAESIKYMKRKLMEDVRSSKPGLQDDDILWILTVPAIWSEPAKQFMREAANKAGIDNCRLRLVLEPEAASVYCQANCTVRNVQAGGIVELVPYPPDYTYIVVDLGGGTVDIATHKVLHGGQLRELFRVTGGALGATRINKRFLLLMEEVFGKEVIEKLKSHCRPEYIEMLADFEMKKKKVKANSEEVMRVKFPAFLSEHIQERHHKTVKDFIHDRDYDNLLVAMRGKLQINSKLIDILYKETVDEIIEMLKDIVNSQTVPIDALLLVGGFADSPYVRHKIEVAMTQELPKISIVKPEESSLHVLKGAVLTTICPTAITERISPFAYGLRTSELFDDSKHPARAKETRRSGSFCADIFQKFIDKGRILRRGDKIKHRFEGKTHAESEYESRSTELYRSCNPEPRYTYEDGCERVAKIVLEPPQGGWPAYTVFDVEIEVGETELHVSVINGTTGEMLNASVDFLGN